MVVTSGVICKNAFAFSLCSHNHMFDESIFSLMPVHVTVGDLVWCKHLDRLFSLTKIMRWAFQEIRPYASGKAKLHNKCIFVLFLFLFFSGEVKTCRIAISLGVRAEKC